MRPTPITDLQMIPYLIRDLYSPAQMSVMMGTHPLQLQIFGSNYVALRLSLLYLRLR